MTPDLAEKIRGRYVKGVYGLNQVAKEFGVSKTTVRRVVEPEYAERMRVLSLAAKRRRTGTCEVCGGETKYNGHTVNGSSSICASCQLEKQLASRIWTREAVIEAIQRWAKEHGRPPSAYDWVRAGENHPANSNVMRSRHRSMRHNPFAFWADAIEAAGFERPETGGRYRERPWLHRYDHAEILRLLGEGLSQVEVSRRIGCSINLVHRLARHGTTAQVRP